MPVEGRGLSSRPTQHVVRDPEIGQPSNSKKCSETADGVTRESQGGSRISLLRSVRQDQPRGYPGACLCPVPLEQGRTGSRRSGLCGHRSVWGGAVAESSGTICIKVPLIAMTSRKNGVARPQKSQERSASPAATPGTAARVSAGSRSLCTRAANPGGSRKNSATGGNATTSTATANPT